MTTGLFTPGLAGATAGGSVTTELTEAVSAADDTTDAVVEIGASTAAVDAVFAVAEEIVGAIAGLAVTATGDAGFGTDEVVKKRYPK